jgi:hypothetical protein
MIALCIGGSYVIEMHVDQTCTHKCGLVTNIPNVLPFMDVTLKLVRRTS